MKGGVSQRRALAPSVGGRGFPRLDDLDGRHRRLRVASAMNDETIKSLVARAVEREVERIEAEIRRRRGSVCVGEGA
jgi:hypothetical protein